MNIAMFSELFYPYVLGGGERQFLELARRLAKRHDVHVYTMSLNGAVSSEVFEGINIHRLGLLKHPTHERSLLPLTTYFLSSLFRSVSTDIIHANTYFPCISGYFKARTSKVPIVATIHDVYKGEWGSTLGNRFLGPVGEAIENIVCRLNYESIISVSSATKNSLVKNFDVPENRINVVPNGIDLKSIDSVKAKKVKNRICYVGRLIPHKHVDELIYAVNKIRENNDIECKIVGGGILKNTLVSLTKRLGLEDNIDFVGNLPDNMDVIKIMKSSDVFVMPSTREGFGIAVLEAMRCKAVPVAYEQDCYKDFCTERNSVIIKRGVDTLSTSIMNLLRSKKRISMAKNGFNTAEGFDWDRITKKVENIYRSALDG